MMLTRKRKIKAGQRGNKYFFGVMWDSYTPQVEAKLTSDMIAFTTMARGRELIAVCETNEADRVFNSLGIKRINAQSFATLWILYSATSDVILEAPEHALTVCIRDMEKKVARSQLSEQSHNGYYLKPQGRMTPSTINLNRPAPNSTAKPDIALILLWT